ncbi:hypothetical protein RJ641_004936 [Dillenia turbinata]|uniref:Uncharacterized protein n=1 Tax=Dillenia turbinata TaxID=194707 RepID=A0AAN8VEZ9_9MAGN
MLTVFNGIHSERNVDSLCYGIVFRGSSLSTRLRGSGTGTGNGQRSCLLSSDLRSYDVFFVDLVSCGFVEALDLI